MKKDGLIKRKLDLDTLYILRRLPYEPQNKSLGIKLNNAYKKIFNFSH